MRKVPLFDVDSAEKLEFCDVDNTKCIFVSF